MSEEIKNYNSKVKEKIKKEIRKYSVLNENDNIIKICANAVLRENL